ncbi:hypothetical protein [Sivoneniella epilithica]
MEKTLELPMDSTVTLRRISVQDYHRMIEAGIFTLKSALNN